MDPRDCLRFGDNLCQSQSTKGEQPKTVSTFILHASKLSIQHFHSSYREGVVKANEVFHQPHSKGVGSRILVEGHAGSGKSTICRKLALDWAQEESHGQNCPSTCVHCFELLILLHASNFMEKESIEAVIEEHLLPKDSQITTEDLSNLLRTKRTLILVDAYDEACSKNTLLDQLIAKDFLRGSTVMVSSRFGHTQALLSHFNTVYSVEGFDYDQKLQHVTKFAANENKDVEDFDPLIEQLEDNLEDISSNPLHLTLLLLLYSEEGEVLLNTRTELYAAIHHFILAKASARMHIEQAQLERTHMQPLYKVAFETFKENKSVFELKEAAGMVKAEDIVQLGYVTQEFNISRFKKEQRFAYPHRSIQEFLSAKHLLMSSTDRHTWLQALKQNYGHWRSVGLFLLALMGREPAERQEGDIVELCEAIMEATRFNMMHRHQSHDYHR